MVTPTKIAIAWRYFLPLGVFAVLVWFLWAGLSLDPRKVPSALLDRPAPNFVLPQLHAPEKSLRTSDLKGRVWLLNVWGSWCVSCRVEHPFLNELAKQKVLPIIGLNWKDKPDEAKAWLTRYGNPYELSVSDIDGRVAIDFGVYGAPETFVIDKTGTIRFKHTGPIDANVLKDQLLPLIQQLEKA